MVERHDGNLPADLVALRALPGFGPYTAGAVGSIALGLDAALVDGNVARVLCRVEGWPVRVEEALLRSWARASELLPAGEAGDFNQALMELGATVCTPATPSCGRCPAQRLCASSARGEAATYPLPKARPARKALRFSAVALRRPDGAVWLVRRERKGLFGGLWELPGVELTLDADARAAATELSRRLSGAVASPHPAGAVSQALTHRDVTVELFALADVGDVSGEGRWVAPDGLREVGVSSLMAKCLEAAGVAVPAGHGRRRAVRPAQPSLFPLD